MVSFSIAGVSALAAFSTLASGHLIMQQPVPYSKDTLDNSPLLNAAPGSPGSNFPCKLRDNAFKVVQENDITVGEQNTISWIGSASHGGGTCQLSVTLDREPSATSKFKVIASWIGGCPTSSDGNGGTHPFNWTMPAEVPNGKATFAWSWVSKLSGQPEYYMNCAPITVSGGASNNDEFDKLEDLFLVNLPSSSCGSQASKDLEIPNPGKYVTTFGSTALATPTGTGCAALGQASATEGAQSGSSSGNKAAYSAESSSAATTPAPYSYASSSPVSLSFPTDTEAPGSTTFATVAYPSATASGSTISNGTGTCTTDGAVVCNGENQFGLCNFGQVVWQDVAAGTTCQNGVIAKRSVRNHRRVSHPHGHSF
ncbi:hypothetical protein MBLNU457_5255t1 [Dothideomycetes sp. NU457]